MSYNSSNNKDPKHSGTNGLEGEFTSPAKSLQNIFRRSGSGNNLTIEDSNSSEGRSRRSMNFIRSPNNRSPTRSPNKSPSRSSFRSIIPNFARSRSSVYTEHTGNSFDTQTTNPFGDYRNSQIERIPVDDTHASINDFADTSSERSKPEEEYDAESVESILHEYSDDKAKAFLFKEHFDEKSLLSKNSISRNKSAKSIIDRTLNDSRNSYGTDSSRSRYSGSRFSGMSGGNRSREMLVSQDQNTSSRDQSKQESRPEMPKNDSFGTSFNSDKFFDTTNISEDTQNRILDTSGDNRKHIDTTNYSHNTSDNSNPNHSSSNNFTTASSEQKNDTTSSSEGRRKYFDSTSERNHTTNSNDTSERPLEFDPRRDPKKYSMISLTSEELINRLDRSLSNLSERSPGEDEGNHERFSSSNSNGSVDQAAMMAYRVSQNQSPKLIQIGSPNLRPMEQAHYHDSDISTDSDISLHEKQSYPNYRDRNTTGDEVMTYAKYKASSKTGRRPPPEAPTHDSTLKSTVHEKMLNDYNPFSPRTEISGIPIIDSDNNSVTSPDFTDPYDDDYSYYESYKRVKPKYYGWPYFMMMMVIGLVIPPVYYLLSLGIFDKLKNSKNYYTGIYYKQQYSANRAQIIKFTRAQKLLSLAIGLVWTAVIFAMIGVGFGLSQS